MKQLPIFFQDFEQVASHRIQLLEQKLSLVNRENSGLLQKVATTEEALANAQATCVASTVEVKSNDESTPVEVNKGGEDAVNSNKTVASLVELLDSHQSNLLASRKKVKEVEKENSDLRNALYLSNLKITELEDQLRDSEVRHGSLMENLESASFEVNFCKAELMEKEAEMKDKESEMNIILEKMAKGCPKDGASVVDSGNEELNSCRKKFEQKLKDEQERLWDDVWKKQNYGMCVQACNMMKTAACKLAFNYLPYKDYLIDCS